MKIGKPLAMLVAIVCCAACEYAPTMLDRTVAYNRAVANSTNQVLLLNVVRASQRRPTYYTRLEGDAASMSLTPNGSLNMPLNNPRSFETDTNFGATGAVTSAATKAVGSLASLVSGLGLQASESNLMTLQTLDDQKYQNGMMTPVPVKNIQAFQDEGYQRDLLFLMFLANVQVAKDLIDPIDAAAAARCAQVQPSTQDRSGGISFIRQVCDYIATGPYRNFFDPQGAHPSAYSFSLRTCQATGGAIEDPAPANMVRFINDPAREGRRQFPNDPHPEVCFQILLGDLLVLGLGVGSATDIPAELVDAAPDAIAQEPHFRAQMIQQNLFLRETSAGLTAICRRKSQDNGFTLAFADPARTTQDESPSPLTNLLNRLGMNGSRNSASAARSAQAAAARTPAVPKKGAAEPAAPQTANAAYPADPVAACQQKNPGVPESGREALLASPDDSSANLQGVVLKPVKLTSNKIAFSTRSFQGMIYYLGETVRYQEDENADPATYPHVMGRNPAVAGGGYVEIMFYGSSRLPEDDAAVAVKDDSGKAYYLPKPCMAMALSPASRSGACSAEYPDNESLQVLNFVNQVWGLQKESVQGPTSPLVVVNPQ